MNLFKFSSISFLFLFCFLVTPVFAVETPPASNVVVLATVNIQNAKIVSQKENDFNISFNISNREGTQSGVKYGVELLNTDPKNQYIADEKVYPDSLTLTPGAIFSKAFIYQAPAILSGTYNLFLMSKNENGLMLGRMLLGKVTMKAIGEELLILPASCYLQVVGEKDSPHYTLSQRVEITKTEALSMTCSVLNSKNKSLTVKPVFETLYQSVYGTIAPQTGGSTDTITIKSAETKSFTITLPTVSNPQVYNVGVKLAEGVVTSNTINATYILSGPQATILNLTIDKNSYKKGETAKLSFAYTSHIPLSAQIQKVV
ncbi:MAG: hypothetical protein WCW04_02505 [Candidatus Paceibacterota bacterium]